MTEKYGEFWWTRMINSVRFLDDAESAVMDGKSVILSFPGEIPKLDIMIDELRTRLSQITDSRTFDVRSAKGADSPGQFLFNSFCSEADRHTYWPTKHKSYERFLADSPTTTLRHRFLCVTDISSSRSADWVNSVSEYLKNCTSENEHGIFILITQSSSARSSEHITCLNYSDYVTDYDCLMLCLTIASPLKLSGLGKQYLAEVASGIAGNDADIAGQLVECGTELIECPAAAVKKTLAELAGQGIDKRISSEDVDSAVWEAQIRVVFPIIENSRCSIIKKYNNVLLCKLPISDFNGGKITNPFDLEIGQLYFICRNEKLLAKDDFDTLKKMRDARNSLAHRTPLPFETLRALNIF